jgi:hypothetical protein
MRGEMPDRFIRESALASETLGQLTDFAERLFWRLTVAADDFGRFNANPSFVYGRCMPLVASASPKRITEALAELQKADTIRLYEIDGKQYGFFPAWNKYQQTRAKHSKFPQPPTSANICQQMPANVLVFESESVCESECDNSQVSKDLEFEKFWKLYPRREHRRVAERSWGKLKAADRSAVLADIPKRQAANWAGRALSYIPHAASYLNQRQWQDELMPSAAAAVSPYAPPKPYEPLPAVTEEQRSANKQALRDLMAGIGR